MARDGQGTAVAHGDRLEDAVAHGQAVVERPDPGVVGVDQLSVDPHLHRRAPPDAPAGRPEGPSMLHTSARNSAISPVSRSGHSRSSSGDRARTRCALGSSRTRLVASFKGWMRSLRCPSTPRERDRRTQGAVPFAPGVGRQSVRRGCYRHHRRAVTNLCIWKDECNRTPVPT